MIVGDTGIAASRVRKACPFEHTCTPGNLISSSCPSNCVGMRSRSRGHVWNFGMTVTQASSGHAALRATAPGDLEEELPPGGPPVVGAGDDLPRLDDLDALLVAVLVRRIGGRQLNLDLARTARVVGLDGAEVAERVPRALLDQLTRPRGRDLPLAEAAEAL